MLTANHLVVGLTFTGLALAPFSQRARCALAYAGTPGLGGFVLLRVFTGIDLPQELTFYSAYHNDIRNVAIHVVFVPLIVWTAMVYLAYVRLPLPRESRLLGQSPNFAHLLALAFTIFHVSCDAALGSLAGSLWWAMAIGATRLVERYEPTPDAVNPWRATQFITVRRSMELAQSLEA